MHVAVDVISTPCYTNPARDGQTRPRRVTSTITEERTLTNHLPVYIGDEAIPGFIRFCQTTGLHRFAMIVDRNTQAALGERVESALRAQGWDLLKVMVVGADIVADAEHVFQILLALDRSERTFVAVGSGTLTDLTRFVSHRIDADYISLPTAPSVDGFTSVGAPMVIQGAKTTVLCHGPLAVFADLPTLCAAPRPMIAAGLADMLAKLTSSADWELTHLLWDNPYDPDIAARGRAAAWGCVERIGAIGQAAPDGVRVLMAGLIESGLCMLDFGESLPASGGEHHISHFLELKLLREGRPAILHGAKVGIAVLINARRFEAIRGLSREEAAARLAEFALPDRAEEIATIRDAYGPVADHIIGVQAPYLEMSTAEFEQLKNRILDNWDEIQRIAATVPPAAALADWISRAGGPITGEEVGLSTEEVALAAASAHYYKDRITINKLSRYLDIP